MATLLFFLFIINTQTFAKYIREDCSPKCGPGAHCKFVAAKARFECSCKSSFIETITDQNVTKCHPIWTQNLEAKPGSILEKAREPRYRRIYKGKFNSSDLIIDAGAGGGTCLNPGTKNFVDMCQIVYSLLIYNFLNSSTTTVFFLILFLTLNSASTSHLKNLPVDMEKNGTRGTTCPYGTIYNTETDECNVKLGEACQVHRNRCGQNTDCLEGKCKCQSDFFPAFNRMDCWPTEDIQNDRRNRFNLARSWRRKDNPENRKIECKNNPAFSAKCIEIINAEGEGRAGSKQIFSVGMFFSVLLGQLFRLLS